MGKARARGLIAEGEIVAATDYLIKKYKNKKGKQAKRMYNNFILLRSHLARINREYLINILEPEFYNRSVNKIVYALIELIDNKTEYK